MEQLYPRNILERHYPVLREQRERQEELEEMEEAFSFASALGSREPRELVLHENEPMDGGSVGRALNTLA